ncbi:hypothetical protein QTI66_14570 [Variovorax sp. J22R133]|nr:hypothetical protein [Variovorax sp. J22R133]MDM0113379.1 hypothetical protein [Variovorax sp. J22R133]
MRSHTRHRVERTAWFVAAAAALAGVFVLYTRPGFLVTLVDQIWACF